MAYEAALREAHDAIEGLCQRRSLLPIRPMVLDSDVLVRNIVREAREGTPPTKLLIHAQIGTIRPFVTRQQIDEVRRHVAEVALRSGVDPKTAMKIFEGKYLPLLWQVDVDGFRSAQVAAVAEAHANDAAIAQLAVLLGVRVVTNNKRHFKELATQGEWLTVVSAYANVGLMDGTNASLVVTARLSGDTARATGRAVKTGCEYLVDHPRVGIAVGAALAMLILVAIVYVSDPDRRRVARDVLERTAPRISALGHRALYAYADLAGAAIEAEAVIIATRLPRTSLTLEQRLAEFLGSARLPVPIESMVEGLSTPARRIVEHTLAANPAFVMHEQGWALGQRSTGLV